MAANPICLPPGFGFHPTDEELVAYYLKRKVHGDMIEVDIIPEVDLYKCEPWDLPEKAYMPSKDLRWHFFCPRDRKYPNGLRTNRATQAGYWKATGKDRKVASTSLSGRRIIGTKKTLVFYRGRAPFGQRSDWIMHEYQLEARECKEAALKDSFVLCRVFKKKNSESGCGAKNFPIENSSMNSSSAKNGMASAQMESARFVMGEKKFEDGADLLPESSHDQGLSNGMTQAEIEDWVEILLDEHCHEVDQYSYLNLTSPSSDEFMPITKAPHVDTQGPSLQELTPCVCPPLMVNKWIPINVNFPVSSIVRGCQSLETANGPIEGGTVSKEVLSAAKTYKPDNPQDRFAIDSTLVQNKGVLKGGNLLIEDFLPFPELEINPNCSSLNGDNHPLDVHYGGLNALYERLHVGSIEGMGL